MDAEDVIGWLFVSTDSHKTSVRFLLPQGETSLCLFPSVLLRGGDPAQGFFGLLIKVLWMEGPIFNTS